MKFFALLLAASVLGGCLTQGKSNSQAKAGLWMFDSTRSDPKFIRDYFVFRFSKDSLQPFVKSESAKWKVRTCYYPGRKVQFQEEGNLIRIVNATDSMWQLPRVFHVNENGELQTHTQDTTRFHMVFRKVSAYPDCHDIFGADFQLDLGKVSSEDELYRNGEFLLELDYGLKRSGYGYTDYSILIEGGPTRLDSFIRLGELHDSGPLPDRGKISLTAPLAGLYDSTAENIRIKISLGGRVEDGREFFYTKNIFYRIR